jgi:hypothetical protein
MYAIRFFRRATANMGPNRFHQYRTVSSPMSIPPWPRDRSSTLRSNTGHFTHIITTRRITSDELLKYRNGSLKPDAPKAKTARAIALAIPIGLLPAFTTGSDRDTLSCHLAVALAGRVALGLVVGTIDP